MVISLLSRKLWQWLSVVQLTSIDFYKLSLSEDRGQTDPLEALNA